MSNEERIEKILEALESRIGQVFDALSEQDLEDPIIKEKLDKFMEIIEKHIMSFDDVDEQ